VTSDFTNAERIWSDFPAAYKRKSPTFLAVIPTVDGIPSFSEFRGMPKALAKCLIGDNEQHRLTLMQGLRTISARSTYYADKRDLRGLGLWPPSANEKELPGLLMPPLDELLASLSTEGEQTDAIE